MNCIWPAVTWLFVFCSLARTLKCRRDAVLGASIIMCAILVLTTEILSLGDWFYFLPLLIGWIVWTVAAGAIYILLARKRIQPVAPPFRLWPDDLTSRLSLIGTMVIIVCVGVIAVVAPPNTWDSLTYHIARVATWVQHRNVGHYPTSILRQIHLGPASEFAVANLQILWGSDRLANLVQFAAMLGCVLGATAIAAKLGVSRPGQALTAIYVAALPIGLLEASSTQTDYVAAFFSVCVVDMGLLLLAKSSRQKSVSLLLGTAVGLAFLTKATTAFFMLPFLIWIFVQAVRQSKPAAVVGLVASLLVLPLLINAGHFYRNWSAFGSVLGPESQTAQYHNQIHTIGAISSNIMRNVMININFHGVSHLMPIAKKMVRVVSGMADNDPRITWGDTEFELNFSTNEACAGNMLALAAAMLGCLLALLQLKKKPNHAIYAICLMTAFFLFCYDLKYQPWITRLQLPLFVLAAPLFGVLTDRLNSPRLAIAAAALLFLGCLPYLLEGEPRNMIGKANIFQTPRVDQYFSDRRISDQPYRQAAAVVEQTGAKKVGLITGEDGWEYPLRILLPGDVWLIQTGVTNESRGCRSYSGQTLPDVVFVVKGSKVPNEFANYHALFQSDDISVIRRR